MRFQGHGRRGWLFGLRFIGRGGFAAFPPSEIGVLAPHLGLDFSAFRVGLLDLRLDVGPLPFLFNGDPLLRDERRAGRDLLHALGGEDAPDLKAMDWDRLIGQVYARKYGDTLPESLPERAKREHFLERRGFGRDDIRRLFRRLKDGGDD